MPAPILPAGFDFLDPDLNLRAVARRGARRAAQVRADPLGRRPGTARAASTTTATGSSPSTPTSRRCRGAATSSPAGRTARSRPGRKEMTREDIELQRSVMLNMDAPHHTRLRKIISRGFTPRAIGRLRGRARAARPEHRRDRGGRGHAATSSSRCRASCRCRRSPACSACRRRTATSSSAGPTR